MERFIVLDIETTGLIIPHVIDVYQPKTPKPPYKKEAPDEILQLAIVSQDGEILFYDSFKPIKKSSWSKAQVVHHITPKDVASKQPFFASANEVQNIITDAPLIVTYNANFDLGFLQAQGINLSGKLYLCAMELFARIFGKQKHSAKAYEWQSLETCASYFGFLNKNAHNALADALLTLTCYKAMRDVAHFQIQAQRWK